LTLPEQIVTFSKDSEITAKENSEMTARPHFNVTPRYTPGSPASVSQEIAKRVAAEERHSIQFDLSGVHGTEARARAEKLGLGPQPDARGVRRGIAEQVVEHSGHWMVSDLLTGEIYARPFAGGKSPLRCAKCAAAKERQSTALFGDAESTDLVAESVEVLIEATGVGHDFAAAGSPFLLFVVSKFPRFSASLAFGVGQYLAACSSPTCTFLPLW
jgi:hypothetical protein